MPKAFKKTFYGYETNEVDSFINNVTKEYQGMLEKLKRTDEENKRLEKDLEQYKQIEGSLRRTLALAEESNQSIRRTANEESVAIIEDAKKNASRIINDALLRASKIQDDADAMKREISSYRNRVKHILEEEKNLLSKYDDLDY